MKLENIPEYACVNLTVFFKDFDEKVLKSKDYDESPLKEAWEFYKLYKNEIDEISKENLHLHDEISPSDLWDNWLGKKIDNDNFNLEEPPEQHLVHAEKKLEEAADVLNLLDERADNFDSSDNIDISSDSGDDTDTKIEKLQNKFALQLSKKSKTDFDPLAPLPSHLKPENSDDKKIKKFRKRISKSKNKSSPLKKQKSEK